MEKRAVIFTLDALIALSIFIISSLTFYPYLLKGTEVAQTTGYNIYSKTQNFLDTNLIAGMFSSALNLHERGDDEGAYAVLKLITSDSEYPMNVRIFVWNGTNFVRELDYSTHQFSENFLFRNYGIFTLDKMIIEREGSNTKIVANSTLAGTTDYFNVTVTNGGDDTLSVTITLEIYNASDSKMNWNINPPSYSTTLPPHTSSTYPFSVSIPQYAVIDAYYAKATVSGDISDEATKKFHVFKFGYVEAEVGY